MSILSQLFNKNGDKIDPINHNYEKRIKTLESINDFDLSKHTTHFDTTNTTIGSNISNATVDLTFERNKNSTMFKLYGELSGSLNGTKTTFTIQTDLKPTKPITIKNAGLRIWNNGTDAYFNMLQAQFTINMDGTIVIPTQIISWDYVNIKVELNSNLYFLENF